MDGLTAAQVKERLVELLMREYGAGSRPLRVYSRSRGTVSRVIDVTYDQDGDLFIDVEDAEEL